jgi:hypothetical protein
MAFTVGPDGGATGHAVGVLDDRAAVLLRFECPPQSSGWPSCGAS